MASGRLPHLASVVVGGFRAGLRSTWPPMTDCAWTSAFTGSNPGAHGIFGSWYRAPGAYECRYFSARDRKSPTVWEMSDAPRWLVWNVPMSYPPTPINGVMVSGYGAPPGARFCEPDGWQDAIAQRWRLDDLLDRAPHGSLERFLDDLVRGLEAQAEALQWAAREASADCVIAVWPHVDRAQHFFWQWRDSDHRFAAAVDRVYEAMDRATGALIDAWPDADFLIVSDHGAGRLNADVNIGAWLSSKGYARYGRPRRKSLVDLAWKLPPSVRKFGKRVAPGTARRAMGATLAGQLGPFEWSRTRAFMGFHGDMWLNLMGREPQGTVTASDAAGMSEEITDELLGITDPTTGRPVIAAVHKREDIYSGPALELAPDLMLDSWSAGYRVAPGREASDDIVIRPAALAGVDEAWSSDHRPVGIFAACGPRIARGSADELSLLDVAPTTLALLGQVVPSALDGRALREVMTDEFAAASPITMGEAAIRRDDRSDYSDDEAAAVAAHLKDLGYIE
jgi:predicted AlkP superfamily phosphohydrolase/phosphomutase